MSLFGDDYFDRPSFYDKDENEEMLRRVKWECKCKICGFIFHRADFHPYMDKEHLKLYIAHMKAEHPEDLKGRGTKD